MVTGMRIATWNVAYGTGGPANRRRREKMQSVDADIWVLTETHDALVPPGCTFAARS